MQLRTQWAVASIAVAIAMLAAPLAAWSQTEGTVPPDSTVTPPPAETPPAASIPEAVPATTTPAETPPPAAATPASTKPPLRDRIYYGGSVVFSFGDPSRIGIYPMVAYKLRPKLSVGVEAGYERVSYDNFDQAADNYGGSVFSRYRLLPLVYLHAEYQMVNYEVFTGLNESDRELVSFLLLGGGISKPIGGRSWAYVEVLFDVLQSDDSPYDDWEPVVSVGVGVGF